MYMVRSFFGIMLALGAFLFALGAAPFSVSASDVVSASTDVSASVGCVYVQTPIVAGGAKNDPADVLKLQYFLTDYEGFSLDRTGMYDEQTIEAVRMFQKRYRADILAPWGLTKPTGDVSVTTLHKINEIYCGTGPVFSEQEKQRITAIQDKYKPIPGVVASTTASSTSANTAAPANGNDGIAVGFMNVFALPILIMLFILLPTQMYYLWGIAPHRRRPLIPRSFE